MQIRMKLSQKGIDRELIAQALEDEYEAEEIEQIRRLLEKKNYAGKATDEKEFRRIYQFLLRRGFRSNEIMRALKEFS